MQNVQIERTPVLSLERITTDKLHLPESSGTVQAANWLQIGYASYEGLATSGECSEIINHQVGTVYITLAFCL